MLYQYVYGWILGRILLQGCLLARVFFRRLKFPCRSLLLSTTVLNDVHQQCII